MNSAEKILACKFRSIAISAIDGVLIYSNEPRCRNVGGFCVEKSNCAKGALVSATGLCPKHSNKGVNDLNNILKF